MRIAFILDVSHRSGLYNGTLMREGVGVSGTETNHILLAEIFAEYGHEVHYISSDVVPGQDRNVMYSQSPPKNNQFDLVFDTFLMSGLNHHVRTDHLILIMQCQTFVPWIHIPQDLYRLQRITGYKKLTFTTQSSWAKKSFHYYNPPLSIFPIHIIGNALDRNLPNSIELSRIPHFVFNSSFERGGKQFNQIFDRLPIPSKTKTVCSYYTPDGLKSLGKKQLYSELDRASYCLFPLTLPTGNVYQDTFNLSCMESLSRGAICVAPKVNTLTSIYEDKIAWVDLPPGHHPDIDGPVEVHDPTFLSDYYIDSFVQKIMSLENDPEQKAHLRIKGLEFARKHTVDQRYHQYVEIIPELEGAKI